MKTVFKRLTSISVLALVVVSTTAACHKPKSYEATVEVTRVFNARKDESGRPLTTDLEFSFTECPGTQIEVIRGGREFSECAQKFKNGDKIKLKLTHKFTDDGHWDYEVFEAGGCARPPDSNDEASYKMVRECSDWKVNGATVGFQCNYASKKELNKKCPWFMRH